MKFEYKLNGCFNYVEQMADRCLGCLSDSHTENRNRIPLALGFFMLHSAAAAAAAAANHYFTIQGQSSKINSGSQFKDL